MRFIPSFKKMDTIPVMLLIYTCMDNQRADSQQETGRINLSFFFRAEIAVKNCSVCLTSEAHTVFHLPMKR